MAQSKDEFITPSWFSAEIGLSVKMNWSHPVCFLSSSLHWALLQLRKPTGCDQFIFTLSPTSAVKTINSSLNWAILYFSRENLLGVINSSLLWALLELRNPNGCDPCIFTLSPTSAGKTYWVWSIHLYTEPYFSWENLPSEINSSLHWALLQLRKPTGCDQSILTLNPTWAGKTYWAWSIHLYTEPYFRWENLLGVVNSSLHWALLQQRKPTGYNHFIFILSPRYFSWENLLGAINSSLHWALLQLRKPSIYLYTEP